MKLTRRGKLIRNLILIVLILGVFWMLLEQPLPLRLDYRRTEKAYFLSPKEILLKRDGEVVSRDSENLYYFSDGRIQSAPLEDGTGWLVLPQWGRDLTFLVFEETGSAVRADLRYTVTPDETTDTLIYETGVVGAQGVFFLPVMDQYENNEMQSTETLYKRDITEYLRGMQIYSAVTVELTLWDAAGELVRQIHFAAE